MKKFLLIITMSFSGMLLADNENYDVKRVGAHAEKGWVYVEVDRLPIGYDCNPNAAKEFV